MKIDFRISDADLEGVEVLLASYSDENYSGNAFVLYRKDGKFYEVNGSHCSCYGLEDQWKPEEADLNELWHRLNEGHLGSSFCGNEFSAELRPILAQLLGKEEA
jgi:hypothetical protein